MRKILLATAATALLGWAGSASASTLSYNILVNGSSVGTGSTSTGVVTGATASGGGFTVILNAIGSPAQPAPYLSTNNFNIASTGVAGVLTIEVTDQGLTSPVTPVMSFFTTNSGDGGGFTSDTISNYYDITNAAYGMGTLLGTANYSGLDSFSGHTPGVVTANGVYSETTIYTLNFASSSNQNASVTASSQIIAQTPEPNSLVLLGTGLFGAAGTLLRRRKAAGIV